MDRGRKMRLISNKMLRRGNKTLQTLCKYLNEQLFDTKKRLFRMYEVAEKLREEIKRLKDEKSF